MSKKSNKKKKRIAEQKRNIENKKLNQDLEVKQENIKNVKEKAPQIKSKKEKKIKPKKENEKYNKKTKIKTQTDKKENERHNKKPKIKTQVDKKENEKYNKEPKIKTQIDKKEDKLNKENQKKVEEEKAKKEKNKKPKEVKKKEKKPKKKKTLLQKIIIIILIILFIIALGIGIYLFVRPKFKDVTIELGTEKISIDDFLISPMYRKTVKQVTDLDSLNLFEVGKKDIKLKFLNKEQTVKLNIVDTTPPNVKLKEKTAYIDYQINPEDFIESKEDLSEMSVSLKDDVQISDYGEYPVTVVVSDKYGNETVGQTTLVISWFLSDVKVELGSEFSVANVVVDSERFGSLVEQSEIAKVDTSKLRNL